MDKSKKWGVISFDLSASMPPEIESNLKPAQLIQSKQLFSRKDKRDLELKIGSEFLSIIAKNPKVQISNIRPNDYDPPDILFSINGVEHGMELSELIIDNRVEKDILIQSAKNKILSNLVFDDKTRNLIVSITLENDYAKKINPQKVSTLILGYLNDLLSREENEISKMDFLPGTKILVQTYRGDLTGDPRIESVNQPLIVFSAQNVSFVPDDDIPIMVNDRLSEKCTQSVISPCLLFLWSNHFSLRLYDKEILVSISEYCKNNPNPYELIIYHPLNGDYYQAFKKF